jgi:dTMP kinase
MIPALQAGLVVLADRYMYTLMARDAVRGMNRKWCHDVFGFAVVPDLVFYLDVPPEELVHRVFQTRSSLDYYESGMDVGHSEEMYESFIIYQKTIAAEFRRMQRKYGLIPIDAQRPIEAIQLDLQSRIDRFLGVSVK